jgi:RNA recognition motif-containing protein
VFTECSLNALQNKLYVKFVQRTASMDEMKAFFSKYGKIMVGVLINLIHSLIKCKRNIRTVH